MIISRFIIILSLVFSIITVSAQQSQGEERTSTLSVSDSNLSGLNRLTVYVVPAKKKYDWSSPHSLYKSYMINAWKNLFSKTNYLLGHAFIELQPVADGERIFTGMRSASRNESKDLVLNQHYGLSILGCGMQGRLEDEEELAEKLKKFSRNGRLAYMVFLISDAASDRLLAYFREYKTGIDCAGPGEAKYGGAFWPRFKGEGAGCSAFAISFLDIAGLMKDEFDDWIVRIDIPMSLVGGPYNNYNEVRMRDIRKEYSWADTVNAAAGTYEHLEMYDPTLMFEWINAVVDNNGHHGELTVTPVKLAKSNGVLIDSRNQPLPEIDSIFIQRNKPSLFIDCDKPN
jgi:hypothetical protein